MATQGGRGDDGGAVSEMDWMVVWCGWCVSAAELGNDAGGARLCCCGRESERDRARVSEESE